ncbi:uncharacterized protein BP01DRAFT_359719 [Aspergillus saccharolyticus JOP 1030-1]|uniref:Mid2 domain-containing protein n=1 Tax=Aspergillus saccharolyticus JOP 1030-1 TaxID=1450539 RepID=A0A318Z442_9EURO|nr:hypothetical protein BP01DRAFT_359719 [Aspergillus saccharolyticus JOP 1030-1]PYH42101.1 hypothetical protein BP01DRAFT_359719 [Aspergillus saccharolyticus JOP 1030-1]
MHVSRILQSAISILPLLNLQLTTAISPATAPATATATATPTPTAVATILELEEPEYLNGTVLEKRCANPCGYYSQLCCSSSESCSTNSNGQAECVSGDSSGSWAYFTTTYVRTETETATFTSTWSSYIAATTSSCDASVGETICGDNCCGPAYVCYDNQCILGSTSIWATNTSPATPAVRGTSLSTATHTASITTTEGFIAPVNTAGSAVIGVKAESSGLSGGAIAGIVIGTIAGVILLLLLCACLCCRGILDSLIACLGCGRRRRKETTYVEERYHRHSHGAVRPEGRTWFGSRPAAATSTAGEKKKSSWSGLATVGIILGALALCLGLKRSKDHRDDDEKTDYTYPSSYYYYSDYYTNDGSEITDDRRTRETRRSRRSRTRSRR